MTDYFVELYPHEGNGYVQLTVRASSAERAEAIVRDMFTVNPQFVLAYERK